jgi:hypothetical protein
MALKGCISKQQSLNGAILRLRGDFNAPKTQVITGSVHVPLAPRANHAANAVEGSAKKGSTTVNALFFGWFGGIAGRIRALRIARYSPSQLEAGIGIHPIPVAALLPDIAAMRGWRKDH